MALHAPSLGHHAAPHVSPRALLGGLLAAVAVGIVIVAFLLRPVAPPPMERAECAAPGACGRTTSATTWESYNPAYGSYERLFITPRYVPDAGGRTTLDTSWATYDPAYGSYRVLAADRSGATTPATDWSRYDPTHGTFGVRPLDAGGRNLPATDWSRYDPTYGSWR